MIFYKRLFYTGSLFIIILMIACNPLPMNHAEIQETFLPLITETVTFTSTLQIVPTKSPTSTNTATTIPSPTMTKTLMPTASPTITPTYSILRGEVNVEHVSCFYGPHKSYLYKYGLVGGSNLEIIGRNSDTNYIEIRAIGGTNPCWMNSEWMNIKGDINSVKPIDPEDVVLPQSPYFGPLTGVNAIKDGDSVIISWNILNISPGKDSLQFPYLIELWVCRDGKIVFSPEGSWVNSISITDQTGCEEKSHARVYGVEKHGYTLPVEVPWPSVSE